MDGRAIGLLSLHSLDVDDVFLPVNLDYFADLLSLVVPSNNLDFVVLADGHGANVVLLPQLFGERGRHDLAADVGRRIEMPLAVLAPVGGHEGVELHFG